MLKWMAPLPGLLWFLIIYGAGDSVETMFKEPVVILVLYFLAVAAYYLSFTDMFRSFITMPGFAMGRIVSSSGDAEDTCIVVLSRLGILAFIYGLPIVMLSQSSQ